MELKPGWMQDEVELVEKQVSEFPDWLKVTIGIKPKDSAIHCKKADVSVERMPMVALDARIVQLGAEDLHWPFRAGLPYFPITSPEKGACPNRVTVDPFPCYPHEAVRVGETARKVEDAFPMGYLPTYYLLPHEEEGRTNGHANRLYLYNVRDAKGDYVKPDPYQPYIVLSGKRIPIHPAMTRYLVAHEYGHVVQWWIERKRGFKNEIVTELDKEYAALRGLVASDDYGGGRWHANVGELFANDFRILVCGVETEYWPHPGFPRPETVPAVQAFWEEARSRYAVSDPRPEAAIAKETEGAKKAA